MNAPARNPGDLGIANSAEAALFHPEKAKSFGTPERVQHVKTFPFFEIGFKRRVVRVPSPFTLMCRLVSVLLAWYNQALLGCPSSSYCSPKKHQLRPRLRPWYFSLSQVEDFFGCLLRAHRHKLWKIE